MIGQYATKTGIAMKANTSTSLSVEPREVAEAMGISLNLFYREAAAGNLPFPVYRVGKRFVTPRAPFERAMRGEAAINGGAA